MERNRGIGRLTRAVIWSTIVAYIAGCTHMPSGEKAFDSFESCFASNMGLAALGGVGVGLLTKKATKKDAAAIAAGVAATAMIAVTAWRKCSVVYSRSERIDKPAAPQPAPAPAAARANRQARLGLDRLDVRVEGGENDPPVPEFDLTFADKDPAARDIKARFRHKVEIVRFTPDANDRLVLADANGQPMLGANGAPIPLEDAIKLPRNKLQWIAIAEDGKQDYVEDVVIQQAQGITYRHKIPVPPRAQLPLPLPTPMRYTLTVEAAGMTTTRSVDFALLDKAARPKRYAAGTDYAAASGTATRSLAGAASNGGSVVAKRKFSLLSEPGAVGKPVGTVARGERLQVDAHDEISAAGKAVKWVKVTSAKGSTGWMPEADVAPVK